MFLEFVHPDYHAIFIGQERGRRGDFIHTSNAQRVASGPAVANLQHAMHELEGRHTSGDHLITLDERFANTEMPANPSKHDVIQWLQRTQNAKSMKALKFKLADVPAIPKIDPVPTPRCNYAYHWDHVKYVFLNSSAEAIWSALNDYSHFKVVEVTRKSYIGLLQCLDMLGEANGEPPL